MSTKPMPDGHRTVTPFLIVEEADKFIDFLKHTFMAKEVTERFTSSEGVIQHVEISVGDSIIELSEARERFPSMQSALHVFVEDTDCCYKRALEAGATSLYEPQDMPYGERSGGVKDASVTIGTLPLLWVLRCMLGY
jgi:PhnB protein